MCWFLECPGRCHRAMGHQSRKGGNVSRSSYLFWVVFLNCQWWCWWWCSKKCSKNDLKKERILSCVWTTHHCFKTIRQSVLHVFQSLLWQVCLLFHAILLQQGCPIAGATATGHGGRGWGRQRGPRQGRWSLSILELRTISSFSTWSPPSSGLGHRCRRRTKGQPGPSPGGGHRVRIAGRHPTAILAGPFAVANLRLTYLKSSSFPSFFPLFRPSTPFRPRRIQPSSFPCPLISYRVLFHLPLCRQHQHHRQQQPPLLRLKKSHDFFLFPFL